MNITWNKTISSIRPVEKDETSSKTSVYLRKNIVEKTNNDDDTVTYEYDEACLTKEEYARYQDKLDTEALIAEVLDAIFSE